MREFTPIFCTVATAIPNHPSWATRSDLCQRIKNAVDADKVEHQSTEDDCYAYITLRNTVFDKANAEAIGDIIDGVVRRWEADHGRGGK
jgi:hypothetical protein